MSLPVKLVGLQGGEQLIGQIVSEDFDKGIVTIKNPAILIPAGQGKLALVPWLPYTDAENGITTRGVNFIIEPQESLLNEYNTGFVSGLVVPSKSVQPAPAGLKLVTE
jgi:hypothetical protein